MAVILLHRISNNYFKELLKYDGLIFYNKRNTELGTKYHLARKFLVRR